MRIPASLMVASVALAMSGCTSSDSDQAGFTAGSERPYHNHSSHDHDDPGAEDSSEDGSVHEDHGTSQTTDEQLVTTLLAPSDLPSGYLVGAHHEQPATGPVSNSSTCQPLATLLAATHTGDHEGHGSTRPSAVTLLSKSHFGPQIMEAVVDHGTVAAAESGLDLLRSALRECSRYTHSASAIGANAYRVEPGPNLGTVDGAVSLRLVSVGPDFDGDATINWDVWSTRVGSRLLTVAFRSAPGGDNADLEAAVSAALDKQQPTT